MNGWVIVYRPGGDIYQMIDGGLRPPRARTNAIKKGFNILLTCVQVYYWFTS